jgi:indolepyruvate ferredoxin oxidoreductase beta subunit
MTTNIILAGVGGQGVLSIAAVLDTACLNNGLFFKQSEVHGMSQRGGAVQSHIRISDDNIFSDIIPLGEADIILSTEPLEALRYLPFLKKDGWIITDTQAVENIPLYPDKERILDTIQDFKNHNAFNATEIARKAGNAKAANMVLLGTLTEQLPIKERALKAAIKSVFERKGRRFVDLNLKAFEAGKVLETVL